MGVLRLSGACVLDHSFGDGTLHREDIAWPGSADGARAWLADLHAEWVERLAALPDHAFASTELTRWLWVAKTPWAAELLTFPCLSESGP